MAIPIKTATAREILTQLHDGHDGPEHTLLHAERTKRGLEILCACKTYLVAGPIQCDGAGWELPAVFTRLNKLNKLTEAKTTSPRVG